MDPRRSGAVLIAAASLLSTFLPRIGAAAQDSITVGTATATGTTVDIPVSIRDVSTTPLGIDQPPGSKIQSYSITVNYAPASAVQSVTFSRSGITAGLTPTSEFNPSGAGTISLLDTFQESTNPIPFTLNAAAPGNKVAHLVFTLSGSATPGTTITLTLDPTLTQLTDQGGNAATKETVSNGNLTLVNGVINVAQLTVSLTPSVRSVPMGGTALLGARISSASSTNTTVNLSSSNTAIARVPAAVVIPAGEIAAEFQVTGVAVGSATITATLGSSTATATANVVEQAPQCSLPAVPQVTAPVSSGIGAAYLVSWAAVANATEYQVDEATDAGFANATTQTVTGTSVSFTHSTGGARYYYRVRARNHGGACDLLSASSEAVSVLINVAPPPETRVVPVVGSLAGSFGSFFKTSVQMYNPGNAAVSGKIVFHPAGASGTSTDPSLAYAIQPKKTLNFADLLPAINGLSGIGSADLVADATSSFPVVLARVFNDAGALGTTGLAEEAFAPADALQAGNSGVLLAPGDVQRFRLNIGVRTLEQGAALTITVRDKDGAVLTTVQKSFGATFFTQTPSSSMLDGFALTGGETLTFEVTSGSTFVYGATTDNTTNDPSVQFAHRIE